MFKKIIFSVAFMAISFLMVTPVLAQNTNDPATNQSSGVVSLDNPLAGAGIDTPQKLIGRIISTVLGIIGSVALLMFIYGGLIWMTAAGNEKKVAQGRDILMWAAIGLVIIFTSYAAVRFVINEVIGG